MLSDFTGADKVFVACGYGELKLIAPSVIEAAKRASVPVVVHYDHGLTFERCIEALKLGFYKCNV